MKNIQLINALDRIAFLRDQEDLTDFCSTIGLKYETVKKWKHRKSLPDSESMLKIAQHFQVDFLWLVTGEFPPSTWIKSWVRRLKLFRKRKGWSLKDFAQQLSIEERVLKQFENGTLALSQECLHKAATTLGIPVSDLFNNGEAPTTSIPEFKIVVPHSIHKPDTLHNQDYVSIPLTDSNIAAGEPIIQDDSVKDYVLLHVRSAGKRNNLVASRVDGDSMEPMLHSGDIVVIDRDDKRIQKNKMYAIFHEQGLTAKYVEIQKKLMILRPINPTSQIQILDMEEHPDPVVGRIIGAWKEL